MYLLIDNYDSFTYNLWHYLGELGAKVEVVRNDQITVKEVLDIKPRGIILSPGPCDPNKAGISLKLVRAAADEQIPLFGVCLGYQSIGQAFKGRVVRANVPMHGKISEITHNSHNMFKGIPNIFKATRYHSLILERVTIPEDFEITAETNDGIVMALAHKTLPISGVQFHPESIASEHGHKILNNFLNISGHKTV